MERSPLMNTYLHAEIYNASCQDRSRDGSTRVYITENPCFGQPYVFRVSSRSMKILPNHEASFEKPFLVPSSTVGLAKMAMVADRFAEIFFSLIFHSRGISDVRVSPVEPSEDQKSNQVFASYVDFRPNRILRLLDF